jgi:Flp pilus assembly protein protease CpaA
LLLRITLKILVIISVVVAVAKAVVDAIVADKEVIVVAALIELTLTLQLYLLEYN